MGNILKMRNTYRSELIVLLSLVLSTFTVKAGLLEQLFYDGVFDVDGNTTTDVADLLAFPDFPDFPADFLPLEEGLSTPRDQGDDFGSLIRGYLQAPKTGSYTFYTASDDASIFSLSTDHTPANLQLIAEETGCCTSLFTGARLEERSGTVELVKGDIYYFEAIYKEGAGGDWMDVGWEHPDGVQEIVPRGSVFPGLRTGPPIFEIEPFDVFTDEGVSLSLSGDLTGEQPMTFQWSRNGVDLPGEILATLAIESPGVSEDGSRYSLTASNSLGSATTFGATLFVLPDLLAPEVSSIDTRGNPHGLTLFFSESVTEASATDLSNYSIDNGAVTISSAVLTGKRFANGVGEPGDLRVTLTLEGAGWQKGSNHTISVSGITDKAETPNSMLSITSSFFYGAGQLVGWDFNGGLPEDSEVAGVSEHSADEGVDGSGALIITRNLGSQLGGWTSPLIGTVEQIILDFDIYIDDGTARQADGISLGVGDDLEGATAFGENGRGSKLRVNFDNWDNGGMEAPAIDIVWENEVVATVLVGTTADSGLDTDGWWPVHIEVTAAGDVTVVYNEDVIHDRVNIPGWTTIENARMAFGGRTGGANANQWIDNISFSVEGGAVGVVEINSQSSSATLKENDPFVLEVAAVGASPISYQWYFNGDPIEGATQKDLRVAQATLDTEGTYTAVIQNEFSEAVIEDIVITIPGDRDAPVIEGIRGSGTLLSAFITFDEQVSLETAENIANYSIVNSASGESLAVSRATLRSEGLTVKLDTGRQTSGETYLVTVTGLADVSDRANEILIAQAFFNSFLVGGADVVDSWDFNDNLPAGSDVAGSAQFSPNEGVDGSGALVLTRNEGGQLGGWLSAEVGTIDNFIIDFDIYIADGTAIQADGLSMSIADDLVPVRAFSENGIGSQLSVNFDNWQNGDEPAPEIEINWDGDLVATVRMGTQEESGLDTDGWWPVHMELTSDGDVTLLYNGELIHDSVNIPEYAAIENARIAFGARTGGANANQWIDNFRMTRTSFEVPPPAPAPPAPPTPPVDGDATLSISTDADGNVVVTFTGVLQTAPDVTGPWTDAGDESQSPKTLTPDQARLFGRSRTP